MMVKPIQWRARACYSSDKCAISVCRTFNRRLWYPKMFCEFFNVWIWHVKACLRKVPNPITFRSRWRSNVQQLLKYWCQLFRSCPLHWPTSYYQYATQQMVTTINTWNNLLNTFLRATFKRHQFFSIDNI